VLSRHRDVVMSVKMMFLFRCRGSR
jgi:hypothetical protein